MSNGTNEKKKNRSFSTILKGILIAVVILIVLIPIIVNWLLYAPIPTPADLGNEEWVSFWGSYLGGCFGGVCTLITIYATIKYYEKQDREHKKELEDQREEHEKELHEEIIRRYRPLLILQPNGGSGSNGKYNPFALHVHNVSEFAAINVKIEDQYEALMKAGNEKVFNIKSSKQEGGYSDVLTVSAGDVLGNEYTWKYQLEVITGIKKQNGGDTERYYYKIISEERK